MEICAYKQDYAYIPEKIYSHPPPPPFMEEVNNPLLLHGMYRKHFYYMSIEIYIFIDKAVRNNRSKLAIANRHQER